MTIDEEVEAFLDHWEEMFTPEGREAVGAHLRVLADRIHDAAIDEAVRVVETTCNPLLTETSEARARLLSLRRAPR